MPAARWCAEWGMQTACISDEARAAVPPLFAREIAVAPVSRSSPTGNRFLDALSEPGRGGLLDLLEPAPLTPPAVLVEAGTPARTVYFPVEGMISMVMPFSGGAAVEVATIGREGIAGLPTALGGGGSRTRLVAQVRGRALAVPTGAFAGQVLQDSSGLRDMLLRYSAALFGQVAQVAGCNRLHGNDSRLARWLLMIRDRVSTDSFDITHEYLAQMLGTRRETVTVSAGALQAAGMITYGRGRVQILDRPLLEEAACECYAAMRAEADSVFER